MAKIVEKARVPASVIMTARLSGMRAIQPRSSEQVSSAAPSRPAR
ncbi:hypothetical protein [Azospirillum sp. B510]|nr:hypothetical protein [Azospirillum sp. B510]